MVTGGMSVRLFLLGIAFWAVTLGVSLQKERARSGTRFPLYASSFLEEPLNAIQEKSLLTESPYSSSVVRESVTISRLIEARANPAEWSQKRIREIAHFITVKSREAGVSPYLVLSMIDVESSFSPSAVSAKGAIGLMQLMPETARQMALELGVPEDHAYDLVDPKVNVALGLSYLLHLKKFFPKNQHLLVAYNLGPAALQKKIRNREKVSLGYYRRVMSALEAYKRKANYTRRIYSWL
jgi:soluble lytic murein transglycosylase-like protein